MARGYEIVARNYRATVDAGGRSAEIDIIARHGECLVFVEVRARSTSGFGGALNTVGRAKQSRLARAARVYLEEIGEPRVGVRFDVVAFDGPELHEVTVVEGAFEVTDPWR